ncbi:MULTISPECIES: hypothetical protein [Nocardia]|uniref:Resolvase/invertase-type recombinase catalytic domain-containing protein n=1 Tax=Nocardia sputorum TaxID=2984338 RepID=A0ABM8CY19_9NOCA|nr:hypothetical protein [Nocardia sputorum]BDT91280.1 hypothetical protein IFM12275_12560 [Nocardia sputorum]BDT99914.1 hypothetical protein IFM12276_29430 [Nocardia sputorum]
MTDVLPLAYGYLRDDLLGERDAAEDTLRAAANALGYELGTVFHEPRCGSEGLPPAFVDLLAECRRAAAEAVITPQGHLSETVFRTVLQSALTARGELVVHEVGS